MLTDTTVNPSFALLLEQAITHPGKIHAAYTAFHGYSLGNQLLALMQCIERGLQPGPIATFPSWKAKGRFVRKGEKALTLCMPITITRKGDQVEQGDEAQPETFTRFVYKPRWFVLSQTDGADATVPELPTWNATRALEQLQITVRELVDQRARWVQRRPATRPPSGRARSPGNCHRASRMGSRVVLGHTLEHEMTDGDRTPRTIREVEAEAVAMLCCAALELPGVEYSRGYIQHWNRSGEPIPERSCARIFKAADAILRAGRAEEESAAIAA
jgi:hypothetical protein